VTGAVRRSTGQHYSTISARYLDITTRHPSWSETGKLIETLRFPASSMTAPGYYQVTVMVPSWILESHAQKIGRNYGIVSAEINRRSTAPPDTIFFFTTFWDLERQPNRRKKGKYFNIEFDIQSDTGGQYQQ